MILDVVCPLPLHKSFDYLLPAELNRPAASCVGVRVRVPFGKKEAVGLVVGVKTASNAPVDKLKAVMEFLDDEPVLSPEMMKLGNWISDRYAAPIGEALFALLPPGKGNPKPFKDPSGEGLPHDHWNPAAIGPTLHPQQKAAAEKIHDAIFTHAPHSFLLLGVAAAGKTEVYLSAIKDALDQGKTALYLVPEIGLSIQTEAVVKARFGEDKVMLWHSDLTPKRRLENWQRMRRGEASIVIGPRSAALAPVPDLGVVIVDEEHDSSFKEERTPRFHARDVAVHRAQQANAVTILGSATPSLETYHAALTGKYGLLEINERAIPAARPHIRVVNLSEEKRRGALSEVLMAAIGERLKNREQTILFLNKRGFFRFLKCPNCTWVAQCPKCGIALVEHKGKGLKCHYCSYSTEIPKKCPQCSHDKLFSGGFGTERLEADIQERFPWTNVIRWDRDAVSKKGEQEKIFNRFRTENVDILVGTQMIAQGFNFPRVSLVGVIDADLPLYIPDFRAAERTYQLLSQVAGRAGRAMVTGEVIVQTKQPDHYALQFSKDFNYKGFANEELKHREELNYPPYAHLVEVVASAFKPVKAEEAINQLVEWAQQLQLSKPLGILGPSTARRVWKAGRTRFVALIKVHADDLLKFNQEFKAFSAAHPYLFSADVDPESLS